mmetsp:Transcript_71750/g.87973  ORF Transcript_71750/g.87973 Transcript_71750/m.87973 type:complete len:396 (+) Transcript_71750:67-1254(+)
MKNFLPGSKSSLSSVELVRKEVFNLIKKFEPNKIDKVNDLMKKYKGKEQKLLKDLCTQYKVKDIPKVKSLNLKKEYSIGKKLGAGGFATVRRCKRKSDGKIFALKVINKKNLERSDLIILESEVNIMRQINHPNIVVLYDIFEGKTKLCLVLSLLEGGELFDRIIERGHFSERDASNQFVQMLSALSYLHDKKIVHRDLKPENLLYQTKDDNSPIKLIDFGLAGNITNGPLKTPCGTPNYVAPEILRRQPYGPQVDMWSIGVILYILLCGFPPFYDDNDDLGRLYKKIKNADYSFPKPYWNAISDKAKDIIQQLLVADPDKRLSANQALNHDWCKGDASTKKLGKDQLFHLRRFQYIRRLKRGVRCILAVCKLIDALGLKSADDATADDSKANDN